MHMNPIKTPLEMLYEQIGITPQHFAKGGPVLTPEQMQALLIFHGKTPPKFAGGGNVKKLAGKAFGPAVATAFAIPELADTYHELQNKDYGNAAGSATGAADTIASGLSIPYWLLSTLLGSSNVSAGTLDTPEEQPGVSGQLSQYLLNLGKKK
ncbi:hypothetical protein UFOVP118_91 [uncultured Caudovirales phage]|uniref:Uncharacterized protein n=1 Tax=uncultured Caudovirales phage TaxID=2100421 RepID=A0A6J5L804_9CAUD|nr:hypothetical protein UFOVP118_91 [uncultured Caudovirales phage]